MEYTIQKLASLSGVSKRMLRYYDQIGLLTPGRGAENDYRIYGEKEVDRLQQILFYREMGMELSDIRRTLDAEPFQQTEALRQHLQELLKKKARIDLLIETVTKTIEKEEGRRTMTDQEKFEGFKQKLIQENEAQYGPEIRRKYGEDTIEKSNARLMKLTEEEYRRMKALEAEILEALKKAVQDDESPGSEVGAHIARLHREWLSYTWPTYSVEAHRGLTEMYTADERFRAYYDREVPGCAEFLREAVHTDF